MHTPWLCQDSYTLTLHLLFSLTEGTYFQIEGNTATPIDTTLSAGATGADESNMDDQKDNRHIGEDDVQAIGKKEILVMQKDGTYGDD